ncbi:hypothetical protein HDV04_002427 [Boothiomyces sp. JEL0838]|nr:hypothetical protein HDV04_002427 [Boothiomyces sp. JEL0838]
MQIESSNAKSIPIKEPFFSRLFSINKDKRNSKKPLLFSNGKSSKVEQSKMTLVNQSTANVKTEKEMKLSFIQRLLPCNRGLTKGKSSVSTRTEAEYKLASIDDKSYSQGTQHAKNSSLIIEDLPQTKSKWFWKSNSREKKRYNWIWKRKKKGKAALSSSVQESTVTLVPGSVKQDKEKTQSRQSISFVDEVPKRNFSYPNKSADDIHAKPRKSIIKSPSVIVPSKHIRKSTSSSGRRTSFSQDIFYITGNFPSQTKTYTENLYASFRYYIEIYGIELVQASSSTYQSDLIDMDHYGISYVNINWEAYGLKHHYEEFLDYLFADYTQKLLNRK